MSRFLGLLTGWLLGMVFTALLIEAAWGLVR